MKQISSSIMSAKTKAKQQLDTLEMFFYFILLVSYVSSTSIIYSTLRFKKKSCSTKTKKKLFI